MPLSRWQKNWICRKAQILPLTVQGFDGPKNYFDVVLSVASINHLDEKSCIALLDSPDAVREYQNIFRNIAAMMRPGGKLIIMDAARHNVFGDLGMRKPINTQHRMVQASAAGVLGQASECLRLWRSPYHVGQRQAAPVCQTHFNSQDALLFRAKRISP